MRIPKRDVTYTVAWHDEEQGIPFFHESHFGSKREAQKALKRLQPHRAYDLFVARVTVEPATTT